MEFACSCPDYEHRISKAALDDSQEPMPTRCKHGYAVEFSLKLRERVTTEILGFEVASNPEEQCLVCGSNHINKWGWRYRKDGGRVQRFKCISCGHRWNARNLGFENMRANPHAITVALDLYFKGVSLRKIVDHLKQFERVNVSYVAVYKWIQKYVALMKKYVDDFKPELSKVYHADEVKVNVRGEWVYLWNLMDGDTRFLLASHVSRGRTVTDARQAFQKAKQTGKTEPSFILTDGLPSYIEAARQEFPNAVHIPSVGIQNRINNNRIERYHGTFRERNKVMRAVKKPDSPILEGQRVYYDYLRPHMGLNGKTPAEVAGINLELEGNRWEKIIKRAAAPQKLTADESTHPS
jgi:transposase-like protein/DNA-directed RNA polymerase subunit M/transcription elongation factor TFIIS